MKKFIIGAINLTILLLFTGCGDNFQHVVNKNITGNTIEYEFKNLSKPISASLDLKAGDTIETIMNLQEGNASIKVEGDNKKVPYEGNLIGSSKFTFEITDKGTYTFTLSGDDASGNITFKKVDSSEKNKDASGSSKAKKPEANSKNNQDNNKVIIEGTEEKIDTEVNKSNLGYTITYDKNRFKFENAEGVDSYMAPNADTSKYPNVFLAVSKIDGMSLEEVMKGLIHQATKEAVPQNITIGKEGYKAERLVIKEGNKYNSRICEYYLTEKNNVVYLVEINYFVGAEEGYGTRLHEMLNTFTFN
ncbi:hypothetical protein [Clostridium sp. C2-6-12]|uniref:hypothetical protein n=1 Tax=Clostridium sp. C2-6-12 TaxID=2698832 RepID=UPI001369C7D9|nr:hypothetical protein [Clostridium sp. C2-6-12]